MREDEHFKNRKKSYPTDTKLHPVSGCPLSYIFSLVPSSIQDCSLVARQHTNSEC